MPEPAESPVRAPEAPTTAARSPSPEFVKALKVAVAAAAERVGGWFRRKPRTADRLSKMSSPKSLSEGHAEILKAGDEAPARSASPLWTVAVRVLISVPGLITLICLALLAWLLLL